MNGYRARVANRNGKHPIVFNVALGFKDRPVTVPCGQCIGCRLERSRQWAIRCSHEAQMYVDNSFITLTYDDEHLPTNGSLNLPDFQKFIKKLRKVGPFRYYHCGEYGEKTFRPHYHACLFGFDFPDKKLYKTTKHGHPLYNSELLDKKWGLGHAVIGEVTFESAAYCARYIMKKINGDQSEDHYSRDQIDPETGEIKTIHLKPEYTTMSRNPGIGSGWMEKFLSDVYPNDFVVMNGKKMRPPKYYDGLYEITSEDGAKINKRKRRTAAKAHNENNTPDRLKAREEVQAARLKQLPRNLEGH
ncbi:replication initiator protein [Microviridae sp.]|nr:replication initiator protein [Microviridae sp.]